MYRATVRITGLPLRLQAFPSATRRFATRAAPAQRPRSWKSSALRWGLVVGAVYYYNTSPAFAEEAEAPASTPAPSSFAESDLPTVESVVEQKRRQLKAKADEQENSPPDNTTRLANADSQPSNESQNAAAADSPAALEEEADQQGAFNPETGEINWDCPCLGGMADGPCGDEFKAAFSCFVYSKEEPKGMDCIDKFQGMQQCFRKYPDIYGAELADDDEGSGVEEQRPEQHQDSPGAPPPVTNNSRDVRFESSDLQTSGPVTLSEVPRKWEDATEADGKDAQNEQPAKKAEEEKTE